MTLLQRNPDLLLCWAGDTLLLEDLAGGKKVGVDAGVVALLEAFGEPRSLEDAASGFPEEQRKSALRVARRLRSLGLLIEAKEARRRPSRILAWNKNLASAFYHAASRDRKYARSAAAVDIYLKKQTAAAPRPAYFKRSPSGVRRKLPPRSPDCPSVSLEEVLFARRTVRRFSKAPVPFESLAAIVRGTWGQTAWLDAGPLGRLVGKTSPSAGGLHPIECYVFAWNVRGLAPGLYHYDVGGNELVRLKRGDLHEAAVEAASGQRWVAKAAFLCVMTAVFERTLWRYQYETSYRVLWLDAGHLCQTFDLLATAHGLGPFQTAAIQDSYIEKLLGIDGIREFPVYLCGAGVPAKKLL